MADKKAVDDVQYDDDGKPIVVEPKADDEGDESKSDKKEDKKPDAEGEEEAEDDSKKDDFDDTATPEIPVRKSNAQFIIERKNKKIKKLESKADDGADDDKGDTPEDEEDDSGLSEDASKAIAKEVETKIKPLQDILVSKANEEELKDLFTSTPEAKKYENHIKAYLQHDAYKNVPPDVIYHHLAFNQALAIGAKKKTVADKEAKQSKNGGRGLPPKNTVGDLPSAEDIAEMSEEDFAKMEEDARQGKFINKK